MEQNKRQWTDALPFSAPWLRLRDRFCSPQFNTVYKDIQKRNSETGKTIKVALQWQKDLHASPHRRKPKLCSIYYWQHRLSPYLQIFLGCRPLSWQMAVYQRLILVPDWLVGACWIQRLVLCLVTLGRLVNTFSLSALTQNKFGRKSGARTGYKVSPRKLTEKMSWFIRNVKGRGGCTYMIGWSREHPQQGKVSENLLNTMIY